MVGLAYGLAVDADVPLDLPAVQRRAQVVIRRADHPVDPATVRWLDHDGGPWSAGVVGPWYLLRFRRHTDLLIAEDGSSVRWRSEEPGEATLAHLILDHALPYCLMRRGNAVLHASCLATGDGGCFAVAGRSGTGKSTLAAALRNRGHRFLGDDCVAIGFVDGEPTVAPAYPGFRLDHRSTDLLPGGLREAGPVGRHYLKRRLALPSDEDWAGDRRHRLRTVFTLDPDPSGPAATVDGSAALFALLPHSFHLAVGPDRVDLLDRLARVAGACRVVRLTYDHTGPGLDAALDRIEAVLAEPARLSG